MIPGAGKLGGIPELKNRVIFTLFMLAVYRLGVFVSTPGIDVKSLRSMYEKGEGTLLGMVNLFSGGALENFSIFTLGITPYITMSIIVQLLTPTVPRLDQLRKDGGAGRRILMRYTRIGTIILALFQGFMISLGLESQGLAHDPGLAFRLTTAITLTAGTAFIMWLGEQITEKGIGNGTSIIIFAGIVARMPEVFASTLVLAQNGEVSSLAIIFILLFCLATVALIVYVEKAHRKIPVQYPRRVVGQQMAQAQTQFLPIKLNVVGVLPPIFASSLLLLPTYLLGFSENELVADILVYLAPGEVGYEVLFALIIFVISFFLAPAQFNTDEISEDLKKQGGFIPQVRPGKDTADYLLDILNRLTTWGALYICVICILPQLVYMKIGAEQFSYVFGGTAILIVVGVTIDTAAQIQSMVLAKNYDAFMNKSMKATRGGVGATARRRLLKRS
jgi:preprotein translocase subunit SecY